MTNRSHVVTWAPPTPPDALLSGLEAVRAVADGRLPVPPFAALFGVDIGHVEPGMVRMSLLPAEFHYNPMGGVHGGVAATLLETALAAAVRTNLPPGTTCITMEIKVSYLRGITVATGLVTAEAQVVHAGRQVAMAEGRVTDAAGRLYATATSTCLMTATPAAPLPPAECVRRRVVAWNDPAQSMRRIAGLSGLNAMSTANFAAPVAALLGTQIVSVESGCVRMSLEPGEHLFSQFGAVHGGMTATLLDSVMGCAVQTMQPAGRGFTTLEMKVTFLRAMNAASGTIAADGRILHAGGRMATADARAVDAKGRLCATATTTCLVFDKRPV